MPGPVHFMEFQTPEGVLIQRLERIDSILESRRPAKDGSPGKTVFHFILANNAKVEVLNETRASLKARIDGAGANMVIIPMPEPEPEPLPVIAEPTGNAVVAVAAG